MLLNEEEMSFMSEVMYSEENQKLMFDHWVEMMEEDYGNCISCSNVA